MKKLILLTTLSLLFSLSVIAQTYINPPIGQFDNPRMKITKVEITKKYTIVHFEYNAVYEGTISILPTTHLQDAKTKTKYKFIKAKNIPVSPKTKPISAKDGAFTGKFYFERIPHTVRYMHFLEDKNNKTNAFNFYYIKLQPLAN